MAKYARNISNKWAKHEALRRHSALSAHMPETRRMTRTSLRAMLGKYRMVYVKPVVGSLGKGVMRVESAGRGLRYQAGVHIRKHANYASGYAAILKETRGRPYMVQRGIRLSRYGGRPFDLRVVVQRMPRTDWTVTGIAGRVAHPRKIVTNGSQGGTIYSVNRLLPGGAALERRMRKLGLQAARRLHRVYPGIVELGLDLAVDRNRRLWIIEANTRPDPCPFSKLPNRGMLNRIVRYGAAWGIRYKLHCMKARRGR